MEGDREATLRKNHVRRPSHWLRTQQGIYGFKNRWGRHGTTKVPLKHQLESFAKRVEFVGAEVGNDESVVRIKVACERLHYVAEYAKDEGSGRVGRMIGADRIQRPLKTPVFGDIPVTRFV